jgi:hypothetical protein
MCQLFRALKSAKERVWRIPMKGRIALVLALFAAGAACAADSSFVCLLGTAQNCEAGYQPDKSHYKDGVVRLNALINLDKKSNRSTLEINCREKSFRVLNLKSYSKRDGKGRLVFSSEAPTSVKKIDPATRIWRIAQRVCPTE